MHIKKQNLRINYYSEGYTMTPAISVKNLSKIYPSGYLALRNVSVDIMPGEIFALLGPNGAGKTTFIGAICGTVNITSGNIEILGVDNVKDYKKARSYVGLVPQELAVSPFEKVWDVVSFSRGLFGRENNPGYIETVLKKLSLWDKKDSQIRTLSGGMKRRVMIAKALAHEPKILFLDEPSAGVDVELRKSMWEQIRGLKDMGVTIILTSHYIEEAEEIADRVGIINKGNLALVEEKNKLMEYFGRKTLCIHLRSPIQQVPNSLRNFDVQLLESGTKLLFQYDIHNPKNQIYEVFLSLEKEKILFDDLETQQSSLEEIFIKLLESA